MENEDLISKVMRQMGSKGGKRRMQALTDEERTALAKKAAAKSAKVRTAKALAKKSAAKRKSPKK